MGFTEALHYINIYIYIFIDLHGGDEVSICYLKTPPKDKLEIRHCRFHCIQCLVYILLQFRSLITILPTDTLLSYYIHQTKSTNYIIYYLSS